MEFRSRARPWHLDDGSCALYEQMATFRAEINAGIRPPGRTLPAIGLPGGPWTGGSPVTALSPNYSTADTRPALAAALPVRLSPSTHERIRKLRPWNGPHRGPETSTT